MTDPSVRWYLEALSRWYLEALDRRLSARNGEQARRARSEMAVRLEWLLAEARVPLPDRTRWELPDSLYERQ